MTTANDQIRRMAANHLSRQAGAFLGALMQGWQARRQRRLAERQLSQLDSQALRDLGLCRSEFDSFQAEAIEEAEQTRLRLAILRAGGATG